MKHRLLGMVAALSLVIGAVALGSASATDTAAKPRLTPGTWTGTGVISGSVTDAAGTTTFSGKVGFRLVVSKSSVKGTGSWVRTMVGKSELVKSTMTGIAHMKMAGLPDSIDILYAEDVEGTVVDAFGRKTPVAFKRGWEKGEALAGELVVSRVRKCSASGTIPAGEGMKITWTAKPRGCR